MDALLDQISDRPTVMVLGLEAPGLQVELQLLERKGVRTVMCPEEVRLVRIHLMACQRRCAERRISRGVLNCLRAVLTPACQRSWSLCAPTSSAICSCASCLAGPIPRRSTRSSWRRRSRSSSPASTSCTHPSRSD